MFGFSIVKTKDYVQMRKRVVDLETKLYDLEKDYHNIKFDKIKLETELNEIRPILDSKNYKPALSEECIQCEYSVVSRFNRLIGCRKDIVCEDFKKKED